MSYELSSAPAEEPLDLIEAKLHLKIDHSDEDSAISSLITLARRKLEHDTWRQLVTATWKLYLDDFPRGIKPICWTLPPLQSVSSIEYYDTDGTLQTFASSKYHVDSKSTPGRILLKSGQAWPAVEDARPNAVIVTAIAGYGDAADVPEEAKHALKLLIGHWYLNREAVAAGGMSKEIAFSYSALSEQLRWTNHAILEV